MLKKILSVALVALMGLLVACVDGQTPGEFTVTFNSQGGSAVAAQTVAEGELAEEPADPARSLNEDGSGYQFVGWYTNAEGTGSPYNFETPVTANLTLYAVWSHHQVLRFNTKTTQSIAPIFLGEEGGTVTAAPTAPTREGFTFGGWFRGKPGLTWLEPEAVSFPLTVSGSTVLYAYWEPVNSKSVNWSNGETYFSSFTADTQIILNPLVYQFNHEIGLIDDLSTALYSTEVDWDKAIADGIADYVGDFSKVEAKEYSVEAFDYINILVGATSFPKDADGDDFTIDGKYDRLGATQVSRSEWVFEIRDDIYFEDGTQVTSATYEYTLKQFLDPSQNNFRKTSYYKNAVNTQGFPILNAAEYNIGYDDKGTADTSDDETVTVTWEEVGFEIIDQFSFRIKTWQPVTQSAAVGFGNINLVHPTAYAASLNSEGTNSTYGTPANPFISYGAYIIKSWDENQRLVFNKNFNYVKRDVISYKSVVYEIVADIPARMALFESGGLSAVGLIAPYYEQYAENPNVYKTWDGFPQYLILNYAPSKLTEGAYVKPAIMQDAKFRQALLYGFDREGYANTVYAPNTATILPVPLDTKAYIQDALFYSESPAHAAVLQAFGIVEGTEGYIPERAQTLFNEAFDAFKLANPEHTGPIVLKFIMDNSPLGLDLAAWIKTHYQGLFNTDPENPDKLVVNVVEATLAATNAARAAWDFDIYLASVGFGSSNGIQWQYAGIPFLGGLLAPQFGLQGPFDHTGAAYSAALDADVTIDLSVTLEYLIELGEDYIYEQDGEDDVRPGYIFLYEALLEDGDKAAGLYVGSMLDLAFTVYSEAVPYDATASEPFPGATGEVWNIVAAFETVFLEQVPMVPTVTRSSATLYADNVQILWPDYSSAFGWGAQRYRYLSSDSDFEFGIYNSFKVAFEAGA